MHPFARFKRGHLHLTRLEAFSDAVFAIVVTLLVLELKLPPLKTTAASASWLISLSSSRPNS